MVGRSITPSARTLATSVGSVMPASLIASQVRCTTRVMPVSPTNMWCASSVSMKRQVRDSGSKPDCASECSCILPSRSVFDPLSRTCRFMLTEEAHHMFVGETGITRVVQRTCDAMREAGIDDPADIAKVRGLGVIDLPTIQKKLNLHYSLSLDLFGSEVSTNAANAFNAGIKGRFQETRIQDDHQLTSSTYPVLKLVDGVIKRVDEPALTALNMRLRDDYT